MSDSGFPQEPRPLSQEGGQTARLLALAEQDFRGGLDESVAFRRLERSRRRRAALVWVGAAGTLAAGLALIAAHGSRWPKVERVEVTAEVQPLGAPFRAPASAVPGPPPRNSQELQPAPVVEARAAASRAPAPLVSAGPVAPTDVGGATPSAALDVGSAAPTEADCRKWSTAGRTERAVECFRVVARGASLEAEVALYEAARLSAEGLREPGRALTLLGEHEKRFPNGAMRGEVAWLRVQALRDAGRLDDALTRSEALLSSPEGRTLASELHWLRGRIYQDARSDCARAASEFVALVGEPGARGDEAELRRARCLERLGRSDDAASAYEHYLGRPDARHAAEARERLSTLRP